MVAASAVGTSHLRSDLPCQDAYATRSLPTGELLVAIADGAGSAADGGTGAQLAVRSALDLLVATLAKYRPASPRAWRETVREAFQGALTAVEEHAARSAKPTRTYATTLLLAILHREGIACGSIGDCIAVCQTAEGHLCSLCAPQRGDYANATNFLTQPQALQQLDIQLTEAPVHYAAFLTDGLAPLAMNLAHNRPHPPFFEPLFAFVANAGVEAEVVSSVEEQKPDDQQNNGDVNDGLGVTQLRAFLDSERVNARTDDDKTLILVHYLI